MENPVVDAGLSGREEQSFSRKSYIWGANLASQWSYWVCGWKHESGIKKGDQARDKQLGVIGL